MPKNWIIFNGKFTNSIRVTTEFMQSSNPRLFWEDYGRDVESLRKKKMNSLHIWELLQRSGGAENIQEANHLQIRASKQINNTKQTGREGSPTGRYGLQNKISGFGHKIRLKFSGFALKKNVSVKSPILRLLQTKYLGLILFLHRQLPLLLAPLLTCERLPPEFQSMRHGKLAEKWGGRR